jgi:uncharacterized membrane protein YhaH (DUF805 family)
LPDLLRYWSFDGRASRSEFALIFGAAFGLEVVRVASVMGWPPTFSPAVMIALSLFLSLAISWILLATSVRRLHDLGKTGWLLALGIVPVAGVVLLIWLFARPGASSQDLSGPRSLWEPRTA